MLVNEVVNRRELEVEIASQLRVSRENVTSILGWYITLCSSQLSSGNSLFVHPKVLIVARLVYNPKAIRGTLTPYGYLLRKTAKASGQSYVLVKQVIDTAFQLGLGDGETQKTVRLNGLLTLKPDKKSGSTKVTISEAVPRHKDDLDLRYSVRLFNDVSEKLTA